MLLRHRACHLPQRSLPFNVRCRSHTVRCIIPVGSQTHAHVSLSGSSDEFNKAVNELAAMLGITVLLDTPVHVVVKVTLTHSYSQSWWELC